MLLVYYEDIYTCNRCGKKTKLDIRNHWGTSFIDPYKAHDIFGDGFFHPRDRIRADFKDEVLLGQFGTRTKDNLKRHPGNLVEFEPVLFKCACGCYRTKHVMYIYNIKEGSNTDSEPEMVWNNERRSCPICGKSMYRCDRVPNMVRCTCGGIAMGDHPHMTHFRKGDSLTKGEI